MVKRNFYGNEEQRWRAVNGYSAQPLTIGTTLTPYHTLTARNSAASGAEGAVKKRH